MSSSRVLRAFGFGECEIQRPYNPARKRWVTASHVAIAATLALMVAAGIDWAARANGVTPPVSLTRSQWSLGWSTCLWISLVCTWCSRDVFRSRPLERGAEALRLDADGIRIAGDDTLTAPWEKVRAYVDRQPDGEEQRAIGQLLLAFGATSVTIPLRCLGMTGPETTDLLRTESGGRCDPMRTTLSPSARRWPL